MIVGWANITFAFKNSFFASGVGSSLFTSFPTLFVFFYIGKWVKEVANLENLKKNLIFVLGYFVFAIIIVIIIANLRR